MIPNATVLDGAAIRTFTANLSREQQDLLRSLNHASSASVTCDYDTLLRIRTEIDTSTGRLQELLENTEKVRHVFVGKWSRRIISLLIFFQFFFDWLLDWVTTLMINWLIDWLIDFSSRRINLKVPETTMKPLILLSWKRKKRSGCSQCSKAFVNHWTI